MSQAAHTSPRTIIFWVMLSLIAGLGGCGRTVTVDGTWQDGASRSKSYSKLLVIGVSPDRNIRCAFESNFASQLKSDSTTVISSCDQMNSKEPLSRESVERVVALVHADAVLATRLVAMSTAQAEGNTHDSRGDSRYKATDFAYGAYGMPVVFAEFQTAPPLSTITSSMHVLTKLYDTSNASLIYTIDTMTKAHEVDSTEATLMTIAAPTAQKLRHAGLIR
ncbi:MAG: hypothetical protein JSR36_00905 [Proteobacteria bacterium]|nr:hypothetical protein [Pseudomonadota bacterium]